MIAVVGKTYLARRSGRLVGIPDFQVLATLSDWLIADGCDRDYEALTKAEIQALKTWLPERLRGII